MLSVWYWLSHEAMYFFRARIVGVEEHVHLWPEEPGYIRPEFRERSQQDEKQFRDLHFVSFRAKPFVDGEVVTLHLRKGDDGTVRRVRMTYDGSERSWEITHDETTGEPRLTIEGKPAPQPVKKSFWSLVPQAYAQTAPSAPQPPLSEFQPPTAQIVSSSLQAGRVDVGAEITAVEKLRSLPVTDRAKLLSTVGPNEPYVITFLDLTRHSDPELSIKAKTALKGIDVDAIFLSQLQQSSTRAAYSSALLRIPQTDAQRILGKLPVTVRRDLSRTEAKVNAGQAFLITPSATSAGDRYWIQTQWKAADPAATRCVNGVYQKLEAANSTATFRSSSFLEPTKRLSYTWSKSDAVKVAEQVQNCGATATSITK